MYVVFDLEVARVSWVESWILLCDALPPCAMAPHVKDHSRHDGQIHTAEEM